MKEDTGLLPPQYTGVYTLRVLHITEDIRGRSLLSGWFRRDKHKSSPYSFVDLNKRFISIASRTGPIALAAAHLNYPLGYIGNREELGYPINQMLPHPFIRDAELR